MITKHNLITASIVAVVAILLGVAVGLNPQLFQGFLLQGDSTSLFDDSALQISPSDSVSDVYSLNLQPINSDCDLSCQSLQNAVVQQYAAYSGRGVISDVVVPDGLDSLPFGENTEEGAFESSTGFASDDTGLSFQESLQLRLQAVYDQCGCHGLKEIYRANGLTEVETQLILTNMGFSYCQEAAYTPYPSCPSSTDMACNQEKACESMQEEALAAHISGSSDAAQKMQKVFNQCGGCNGALGIFMKDDNLSPDEMRLKERSVVSPLLFSYGVNCTETLYQKPTSVCPEPNTDTPAGVYIPGSFKTNPVPGSPTGIGRPDDIGGEPIPEPTPEPIPGTYCQNYRLSAEQALLDYGDSGDPRALAEALTNMLKLNTECCDYCEKNADDLATGIIQETDPSQPNDTNNLGISGQQVEPDFGVQIGN